MAKPRANKLYSELEEAELKLIALEMRRDRISVQKIAKELTIGSEIVARWIKDEIAVCIALTQHTAQEIVQLELEELDYLQSSLITDIESGETQAVLAALKISESRRKLLGLDQPDTIKQEVIIREYGGFNPVDDI